MSDTVSSSSALYNFHKNLLLQYKIYLTYSLPLNFFSIVSYFVSQLLLLNFLNIQSASQVFQYCILCFYPNCYTISSQLFRIVFSFHKNSSFLFINDMFFLTEIFHFFSFRILIVYIFIPSLYCTVYTVQYTVHFTVQRECVIVQGQWFFKIFLWKWVDLGVDY